MEKNESVFEKIGHWIRHSVTLKLVTISFLALMLLIPSTMIRSIISEREDLRMEAISEVSNKWANRQLVKGPILTIPMIYIEELDDEIIETIRYQHILPDRLSITGTVEPEVLKRGIYEVVVYRTGLSLEGITSIVDPIDPVNLKEVLWDKAFFTIGFSDLRGIEDQIRFSINETLLPVEPGSRIKPMVSSGVTVLLNKKKDFFEENLNFKFNVSLQGSENLSFIPTGSLTTVHINSPWTSPGFDGNFLPDDRTVTDSGFEADWKVLELNRNYPRNFIGNQYEPEMDQSAFGVNLLLPVDDYQKSMRSVKYAILTIALTFLIFFLVEVIYHKRIHPFQYTLVGLALCLFYILLISISEHLNFNIAYLISGIIVVGMSTLYSLSVFRSAKFTSWLTASLTGIYGFIFVIIQVTDYALLLGSIGLTILLGITMYLTRNIDWYGLSTVNENNIS